MERGVILLAGLLRVLRLSRGAILAGLPGRGTILGKFPNTLKIATNSRHRLVVCSRQLANRPVGTLVVLQQGQAGDGAPRP